MGTGGGFSNAVRITDINDFLSPSAACVLPLGGGAFPEKVQENSVAKVKAEPAGSVLAPIIPEQATTTGTTRAKITVSDCLACSGCVTSAETVLLSTESLDELRRVMLEEIDTSKKRYTVAALSQQAVASIAVQYDLGLQSAARKLSTFLRKDIGFEAVVDLSFARHFALLEASSEFIERFKAGKTPIVTSACPGWLTYAEKTQDEPILDKVSSVRSPQAILPLLAKSLLPSTDNREVWITAIAPCHDKKLEASRPEFRQQDENGIESKDVNCVLTAGELVDLMKETNFDLTQAEESSFNQPISRSLSTDFGVDVGSGSGGFADFILRRAARDLLNVEIPDSPLPMEKASKSGDLQTITVKSKDGSKKLQFATAYGFRSLQSILRKMRRGECAYDYIELMACPGGCTNGGGLLEAPPKDPESTKTARQQANEYLQRVNKKFSEASSVSDPLAVSDVVTLYKDVIGGVPGSRQAKDALSISVQSWKSTVATPAALSW